MSAGTWYTHMTDSSNIKSKIIETKFEIENGLNSIFNKIIYIISVAIILSLALLVSYLTCKCCCKKSSLNNINRTIIELKNLVDNIQNEKLKSTKIEKTKNISKTKNTNLEKKETTIIMDNEIEMTSFIANSTNRNDDSLDSITKNLIEGLT
ncbi:unnamed protein product [Brachionus calyciflorus]|uniref:Uncharacterized protein n=1 Tax=Brachionus calyciflorus TaxID=104777 RepID=A0A814GG47_9BILA|nr:unnamed protein product [Brachionus calyciflorus]